MSLDEDTLTAKANAVFRQAARTVIERARQSGTPIYVWEDGKVVERTWAEMERLLAQETRDQTPPSESATERRAGK
jgi:hypothetical protein